MRLQNEISINIHGRTLSATPSGELDHHQAERLRTQIDAAFDKSMCRNILLDMSNISFMDSSGIGMIIGRYKKAESRGGRLVLAGMDEGISRVFSLSGLAKIVIQSKSVESAMEMLGGNF